MLAGPCPTLRFAHAGLQKGDLSEVFPLLTSSTTAHTPTNQIAPASPETHLPPSRPRRGHISITPYKRQRSVGRSHKRSTEWGGRRKRSTAWDGSPRIRQSHPPWPRRGHLSITPHKRQRSVGHSHKRSTEWSGSPRIEQSHTPGLGEATSR